MRKSYTELLGDNKRPLQPGECPYLREEGNRNAWFRKKRDEEVIAELKELGPLGDAILAYQERVQERLAERFPLWFKKRV